MAPPACLPCLPPCLPLRLLLFHEPQHFILMDQLHKQRLDLLFSRAFSADFEEFYAFLLVIVPGLVRNGLLVPALLLLHQHLQVDVRVE